MPPVDFVVVFLLPILMPQTCNRLGKRTAPFLFFGLIWWSVVQALLHYSAVAEGSFAACDPVATGGHCESVSVLREGEEIFHTTMEDELHHLRKQNEEMKLKLSEYKQKIDEYEVRQS